MPDQTSDGAHRLPTRREVLRQAGRLSIGAAAFPMAGWLSACARDLTPTSPSASASGPPAAATPPGTPAPTATPDTRPVTVAITGDVMLGRSVNTTILASSDRYPFNDTADYLHGFDLTVDNLECVVSTMGQPVPNKPYHFRADPKSFKRLNAAVSTSFRWPTTTAVTTAERRSPTCSPSCRRTA
jgi:hypothetical protein